MRQSNYFQMINHAHLVAFSGHRPENIPGRTERELMATAPRLKRTLQALQAKARAIGGDIHLVSSLAAGADVIACETAVALDIPVHLVLAKPEAAFLETYHHAEPAKNLDHWLPRARAILAMVRPDPDFQGIPINPRHTIRNGATSTTSPECYAEANTRILESADLLLTLSTLAHSKSIAGTKHLIGQATAIGIPTINLDPATSPEAPLPAIPEDFAKPHCESLTPFTTILPHITCDLTTTQSPFAALAKCLSNAAGKSAQWFRRASALAISFHLIATILAAAVAAYYHSLKSGKIPWIGQDTSGIFWFLAVFALIELIFVGAGLWLERRLHNHKSQKTWLYCRFAREIMRSLEKANPFLDPLYPEIQRHQPVWKRFAITAGLMLRCESAIPAYPTPDEITSWRDDYLKGRVKDQETFFHRESLGASVPNRLFHFLTHWSGIAAVLIVAAAFLVKASDLALYELGEKPWSPSYYLASAFFLLFLPILMPLLASIGASFGAVFDYGRRSARYEEIAHGLAKTARILPTLETLPDIATAVRQTEETLQDELIEWFAAQKKGLGH
jgi:predicted membrane channel-forming protein YqfA (hemolysin III family)